MAHSSEPTGEDVDIEGMREYLVQTAVEFAVLFGSHARATTSDSSDIDVAIRFPAELSDADRFHLRNRIDAELQEYADEFVDVSDIDSLANTIAYAALRDRVCLVGDEDVVDAFHRQIKAEYERTAEERERENEAFIDRLARGDV